MSKATAVLGAASVVVALSAAGYCAYRSVVSERRMAGLEARLAEAEKKVAENAKCIEMQASSSLSTSSALARLSGDYFQNRLKQMEAERKKMREDAARRFKEASEKAKAKEAAKAEKTEKAQGN